MISFEDNIKIFEEYAGMEFERWYLKYSYMMKYFLTKKFDELFVNEYFNDGLILSINKICYYNKFKSKLHTWVYKVIFNFLVRMKWNIKFKIVFFGEIITEDVPDITEEDETVKDLITEMNDEINKYPDKIITEIIKRHFFNDERYDKLAIEYNINYSTLKSRIVKFKKIIKEKIKL